MDQFITVITFDDNTSETFTGTWADTCRWIDGLLLAEVARLAEMTISRIAAQTVVSGMV